MIQPLHPVVAVNATMLFFYNVDPREQIDAMLGPADPPRHPDYIEEWLKRYRAGFCEWWGHMSAGTKLAYTTAAVARFGTTAAIEMLHYYASQGEASE